MSQIEVLYHGDIDDAPMRTRLMNAGGQIWFKMTDSTTLPHAVHTYGEYFEKDSPGYQLIRALCLQEPKQSGVWIENSDGEKEFREIRAVDAGTKPFLLCPFCGETGRLTTTDMKTLCPSCGAQEWREHKIWLSPPKAKAEPLDEFEVQIAASIAIMSEKCSDDNDFARGAIDAYKDALKRHREFKEKQKNG